MTVPHAPDASPAMLSKATPDAGNSGCNALDGLPHAVAGDNASAAQLPNEPGHVAGAHHAQGRAASQRDGGANCASDVHGGGLKIRLLDVAEAEAILAEPFDAAAEADRRLPIPYHVADDGTPVPLDGVLSLFVTSTTLDIIGCREVERSPGLAGTMVAKQAVLDDVQFRGAISDFYNCKAAIAESELDQLLLRANVDDTYGDGNNFELVTSAAALARLSAIESELERRAARDRRLAMRALASKSLPRRMVPHTVRSPAVPTGAHVHPSHAARAPSWWCQ